MNISNLLITAATNYPDRPAISFNNITYTWSEVCERTRKLATKLSNIGVVKNDNVAFTGNNSNTQVELFYACSMLGATFVPISYRYSKKEIDEVLRDCNPKVYLDESSVSITDEKLYENVVDGNDYYAITYTGGTSGKPKGVPLSHTRQYLNALTSASVFNLSTDDVSLLCGPIYHLGPQNRIFASAMMASHLVIQDKFVPAEFVEIVQKYKVTNITLAPTMLQMLLDAPEFDYEKVKSIKNIQAAGSTMPTALFNKARTIFVDAEFNDSYGITEMGGVVLANNKPVPHVAVRIVDDELWVKGPTLMDAYVNRTPDFKNDWYQTGDMVKLVDEKYYIVGRKDDMFVSGAVNIHPSEIETVIDSHPKVKQSAVIGVDDELWGQVPRAFVVGEVSENDLISHCKDNMANYKCPKQFVFVDDIPKTGAGKVDKKALKLL